MWLWRIRITFWGSCWCYCLLVCPICIVLRISDDESFVILISGQSGHQKVLEKEKVEVYSRLLISLPVDFVASPV